MKQIVFAVVAIVLSTAALADNYVRGYTRKDGTYVQPHYRSESNSRSSDNYSSQGNTNPYTNERGSQRNEYSPEPAYRAPDQNPVVNPYEGRSSSY